MASAASPQTPLARVLARFTPSRTPTPAADDDDEPAFSPIKYSSDYARGLGLMNPPPFSPQHGRRKDCQSVDLSPAPRKPSLPSSLRARFTDDAEAGKKRILGLSSVPWSRSKDPNRRSTSRESSLEPVPPDEAPPISPTDPSDGYSSQPAFSANKATPAFPRPGLANGLSESSKRFRAMRKPQRDPTLTGHRPGRALLTNESSSSPSDPDTTPENVDYNPSSRHSLLHNRPMSCIDNMDHLQLVENDSTKSVMTSYNYADRKQAFQRVAINYDRADTDPVPTIPPHSQFQRASSESALHLRHESYLNNSSKSRHSIEDKPNNYVLASIKEQSTPQKSPPSPQQLEVNRNIARQEAQNKLEAAPPYYAINRENRTPSPAAGRRTSTHFSLPSSVSAQNSPGSTIKPSENMAANIYRQPLAERSSNIVHDYRVPLKRLSSSPPVTNERDSNMKKDSAIITSSAITNSSVVPSSENSTQPQKPVGPRMTYVTINGKQYAKGRKLGRGGSSTVYAITDRSGIQYALKKVELKSHDHESYRSFKNEIELLERLRGQERIIQLFESEVNDSKKLLLMIIELGEIDLSALLQERIGKQVSMNFIRHMWEQMLEAVNVIHEAGIVHTDLKPANFVLVKGSLKLIDFGIGQVIPDETANIQRDQQIGTANYMPPEALRPEFQGPQGEYKMKLGRPADVWSLGCILYQMVYGITPFGHMRNLQQKMSAIQNERTEISFPPYTIPKSREGDELPEMATKVESDLINVLKSCLQYDRSRRPTIPQLYNDPFLRREGSLSSTSQPPLTPTMISEIVASACRWSAGRSASKAEQDRFVEKLIRNILPSDDIPRLSSMPSQNALR